MALGKPALNPLPVERFDLSQWSRARVNIDYHIVFDTNYYSVPYNLVQELVEVRSTLTTVELFHKGQRVASHLRARGHGHTVTVAEHRPRSHREHLEWTPSRMVHWAESIGPHTARLFERILADKPHPEMGYRSCLGIIRLAGQYSPARMEAAAERALITGACRSILKNALDQQPMGMPHCQLRHRHRTTTSAVQSTSNYRAIDMLEQPMIEELLSMRLQGWRMRSRHRSRTRVPES